MKLNTILSILSLNGFKGYVAGASMLLLGMPSFFTGMADLTQLLGDCLGGNTGLQECIDGIPTIANQVWVSLLGLYALGTRHKQDKTEKALLEAAKK